MDVGNADRTPRDDERREDARLMVLAGRSEIDPAG